MAVDLSKYSKEALFKLVVRRDSSIKSLGASLANKQIELADAQAQIEELKAMLESVQSTKPSED